MADDKEFEKNKKRIKQQAIETGAIVEDALRSIADRIGDILEESMGQVSTSTEKTVKALERDLNSFANSASKVAADIGVKASEGMLKTSDITKQMISSQKKIMALQIKRNILERNGFKDLSKIDKLLGDAVAAQNNITQELKAQLKVSKNVSSAMGLTGNLLKTMASASKKIGISGLDEVFGDASMAAQQMAMQVTTAGKKIGGKSAGLGGKLKVMGAGMISLGKGIVGLFKEPLFYIALITKALNGLKNLVFSFSQESVNLGRNFGTAGDQAQRITAELRTMAATSDFVRGELVEGFTELNQSAGTFGKISKDNLETYVGLTKRAGYSKELAQDLYKLSVLQGKSLKETADIELKRIKSFAKSNNLAIDQKDVFEGIGKMSAATQLSIIGQGKALGDAAIQAKKLGMDMQTLNGIADSLLDFENSIAAEMEAELLTGRQLNLEKARAAALNNDMAGLAKELNKQNIDAVSFGKQNRIQQEATAKALGMSRDALAESLLKQKAIEKGIIQEGEVSLDQQLKQLSLQEKFNNTIENLKEIFVNQLQPVIKDITSFLSDEENYKGLVEGVKSMAKGFGEFMGYLTKGPDLFAKLRTAAVSLTMVLAAAALASSIASGGIATVAGIAAVGATGLGTYYAMGGFDSPSGGSISNSSKTITREDTAMVEAVKENTKVNKEVLAEAKKNNERRMFVKMDSTKVGEAQSQTLSKVE